jgi:serine/threonine protein kinase
MEPKIDSYISNHNMSGVAKKTKVGQGAYGIVEEYTEGKVHKGSSCPSATIRECAILRHLGPHKNIVQVDNIQWYRMEDKYSLINRIYMPRYKEDLYTAIKRWNKGREVSVSHIICAGRDIVEGLLHMETKRVIHSDLTPRNVLIGHDGVACLCDFGVSQFMLGQPLRKDVTTRVYRAPEVLLSHNYDSRADVFSLGCILYLALTGEYPFRENSSMSDYLDELGLSVSGRAQVMHPDFTKVAKYNMLYNCMMHKIGACRRNIAWDKHSGDHVWGDMAELTVDCLMLFAEFRPTLSQVKYRINDIIEKYYNIVDPDISEPALTPTQEQINVSILGPTEELWGFCEPGDDLNHITIEASQKIMAYYSNDVTFNINPELRPHFGDAISYILITLFDNLALLPDIDDVELSLLNTIATIASGRRSSFIDICMPNL